MIIYNLILNHEVYEIKHEDKTIGMLICLSKLKVKCSSELIY